MECQPTKGSRAHQLASRVVSKWPSISRFAFPLCYPANFLSLLSNFYLAPHFWILFFFSMCKDQIREREISIMFTCSSVARASMCFIVSFCSSNPPPHPPSIARAINISCTFDIHFYELSLAINVWPFSYECALIDL